MNGFRERLSKIKISSAVLAAGGAALLVLIGAFAGAELKGDDAGSSENAAQRGEHGHGGDGPRGFRGHEPGGHDLGRGPGGPGGGGFRGRPGVGPGRMDPAVIQVIQDIRQAVQKDAVAKAKPIIDKAEKDKKITAQQADRIRQMVSRRAAGGGGPGSPPGPPGPPPGL